jgi:SAM-dependent methyltransferase
LDHHRGEREAPLIDRDGDERREHPIEAYYFGNHDPESMFAPRVDGPLLDIGAGAGRDTLYFQDIVETVALQVSGHLVTLLAERGVEDARLGTMFSLTEQFERNRFGTALAIGTQVQLAASDHALREFLADLAYVTKPDGVALLHGYDPAAAAEEEVFADRPDPTSGIAYRVYHSEYEGEVGETLLFRLFSVERLREATVGTPWYVADSKQDGVTWRAVLEK